MASNSFNLIFHVAPKQEFQGSLMKKYEKRKMIEHKSPLKVFSIRIKPTAYSHENDFYLIFVSFILRKRKSFFTFFVI